MPADSFREIVIDEFLSSPAGQKLQKAMEIITSLHRNVSEDGAQLNLLRIGTVFQIFLIDTLAGGKKPGEFS